MTTRYQERHYEDVAKALKENRAWAIELDSSHARGVMAATIGTFADLFAADNPPTCLHCGQEAIELSDTCPAGEGFGAPHAHTQGFDRERFLTACGLEPARPYSTSMLIRQEGEPGTGKTTGG